MRAARFAPAASHEENKNGWIYFFIQTLVLKEGLNLLGSATSLNATELNFIGFLISFIAYSWIFRRFLLNSCLIAWKLFLPVLLYAAIGVCGHEFWTAAVSAVIVRFVPSFWNANNSYLISLAGNGRFLMIVGTVLLAPLAEECIFREMIFRKLSGRNLLLAYAVSAATFAFAHVTGYIGSITPLQFVLSFVQYLPAGIFLCWGYHQTGCFVTPLLMHMIINLRSASVNFV